MRVLPGAALGDFATFAAGLDTVQAVLGEHFAPAQGGSAWVSADVARLVAWWRASGLAPLAAGQSSWGPTGFAVVASASHAERLIDAAREAGQIAPALRLATVRARDHGAVVTATGR
jgi:beta-ribofuranosylaminobenzene 5'-phosphate synthase